MRKQLAVLLVGCLLAAPVAAQDETAGLIAVFQERLDARIAERGLELPEGARRILRQKIVEGVRRLEEGGISQDEIAKAEETFEPFVDGLLQAVQTAYPAVAKDLPLQLDHAQQAERIVQDAIFGYCPPPVWFPWCV